MSTHLKLAIAKIGDLLLDNKITQGKKGQVIEDVHLAIPNYQRPYKWTAKNVIQLLDDIINAKNENKECYRVGTLILHEYEGKYNIVDGQQRTISFSLLLKALGADKIDFLDESLSDNPHNTINIPKNYGVLERRVKNLSDSADLLDYIKNNCELVVVITENISEAFQFFDSQNARGKKLYPHDLLKAFHLREMNSLDEEEIEKVVHMWENLNQKELSTLFSDYLYRVKEWVKGNRAYGLTEQNINQFKGITKEDNHPYAQFYKGAFSYAETINNSAMPFVTGNRNFNPYQLDTPIVAGKSFFDYAKHYYEILKDIQDNDKYEGYFINDEEIVKTLDLRKYKNGVGNRISRVLFDSAILLYVDRFCPTERPSRNDLKMLDQFVVFAFIWSYSLRAQYHNLGWWSAQNYIMGNPEKKNSFNIYKIISESDSPNSLLSSLSDKVNPLNKDDISSYDEKLKERIDELDENSIPQNYLHYFEKNNFIELDHGS